MEVKPKISVIIASKNGSRFLRQTLDSILQQSFTDYEIVVADSASTDDTLDILQDYKRNGHCVALFDKETGTFYASLCYFGCAFHKIHNSLLHKALQQRLFTTSPPPC